MSTEKKGDKKEFVRHPLKVAPFVGSKAHGAAALSFVDERRLLVYYKASSTFNLYTFNAHQVPLFHFL